MPPEAAYWALLTGDGADLASIVDAWHAAGNRTVRGLFEQAPQALAMLLDVPEDALAPLLALRARVPQTTRLIERLEREGVSFLSRWDRRYPRALKAALGDQAPPVLWYAGSLELLARGPVAVFGTRDAGPEALAFARALAIGLADQGRPVITGVARAIERAVLETTLGVGGAAIVVLGQGIARAQPGMRRLQAHIAGATLLVLAALTPEAPWQPGLEEGRGALAASLAERVAVAQMGEGEGIAAAVQAACRLCRPVFVREADAEAHRALLADGALALPWPAEPGELAALLLPPSGRRLREGPGQDAAGDEVPWEARAAEQPDQRPGAEALAPAAGSVEPDGEINERRLDEELLRYLRRSRRKATGKGALLQAFPVDESALDRALLALIAAGQVVERSHRSGARYAAVRAGDEEAMRSGFQLSLFGQDDPG